MNLFQKAVLSAACLFVAATPALAQKLDRELLDSIESDIQDVRELELLEPIDVSVMSLEEYQEETKDDLDAYAEEDWVRDTQILAAFGLVDPEIDLYQTYLAAYGGSFVGYYDPSTNEMVLIDFGSGEGDDLSALGQVTFAHETVHALQDQHFDLAPLLSVEVNSDTSLAMRSLVEGDATTAETQYLLDNRTLAMEYIDEILAIQDEGLDPSGDLPEFLNQSIAFPYEYGIVFVQALYDEGGWDLVNEAYENPPLSTEQVLHPEKYLDGEVPVDVELDDYSSLLGPEWEELVVDTHGEFLISVILADADLSDRLVTRASEGWGGDSYAVLGDGDQTATVWDSTWDSERDAREFSRTLAAREELRLDLDAEGERSSVLLEGDDQVVIIEQIGERVVYVQAPTLDMAEDLLDELI